MRQRAQREKRRTKADRKLERDVKRGVRALAKRIGGIPGAIIGVAGGVAGGELIIRGIDAIFGEPEVLGSGELPRVPDMGGAGVRLPPRVYPGGQPQGPPLPEGVAPTSTRAERAEQLERVLSGVTIPGGELKRKPLDPYLEQLKKQRIGDPTRPGRPLPPKPVMGPPAPAAGKPSRRGKLRGKLKTLGGGLIRSRLGQISIGAAILGAASRSSSPVVNLPLPVAPGGAIGGGALPVVSPVPGLTLIATGSPLASSSSLTSARSAGVCSCKPKRRGKPRKCLERGSVAWRTGRYKGKAAGSKCIRFATT